MGLGGSGAVGGASGSAPGRVGVRSRSDLAARLSAPPTALQPYHVLLEHLNGYGPLEPIPVRVGVAKWINEAMVT